MGDPVIRFKLKSDLTHSSRKFSVDIFSDMKLLPLFFNNLNGENSMLYMMAMRNPQMMQYMLPLAAGSGNDNLTRLLTMMLGTRGLKGTAAVGGTTKGGRAF